MVGRGTQLTAKNFAYAAGKLQRKGARPILRQFALLSAAGVQKTYKKRGILKNANGVRTRHE